MNKDDLGIRMKEYEAVSKNYLTRRVPVIIRIDGKSFHSFTKKFKKPFDDILMKSMQKTMKYLCENIQGCVFGYTQSDEITLVLTDYATIDTAPWFDYNVQKLTSIAASMATLVFNRIFYEEIVHKIHNNSLSTEDICIYVDANKKGAMFDARAFNIPKEEVINCLIWRQNDATRNSIQMVGHSVFSHSYMQGKTNSQIQDMLMNEKGINWNDYPTACKRGSACYKIKAEVTINNPDPNSNGVLITVERKLWIIDEEIPIFTKDRNFIEKFI